MTGLSQPTPEPTTLHQSTQPPARPLPPPTPLADTKEVFGSRFMPCPDCGASLKRDERAGHLCEPERQLDYQLFQLREELAACDTQLNAYLASPQGRFEQWYAARLRTQGDGRPGI